MMKWFGIGQKCLFKDLRVECDTHSHLLPGVDDGRFDINKALIAIRREADAGVKKIVLTPHIHKGVYNDFNSDFNSEFSELKAKCTQAGLSVELVLGAEYMCDEFFYDYLHTENPVLLTGGGNSVLIEMSFFNFSRQIYDIVFRLNLLGYTPVLAHPERYVYLYDKLDTFDSLKDLGCDFQLNLLSLTGRYGKESVKILKYLMKKNFYNVVGGDIHSLGQLDLLQDIAIDRYIAKKGVEVGLWQERLTV